jgi:putative ABC transport system permease protein
VAAVDRLNIVVTGDRFDEAHIRNVAAEVRQLVESQGHTVRKLDVPAPGKHPHSDLMRLLLLAMSGFGLFALLLSGVIVVNLLTALMAAQVRQIGVMKTIGATRWQIARIYFGQALLLGVAAIVVAVPLGMLGSRALCRYLAVFLNFDINSFAVPLWVYLLVAVVGIIVPLAAAAYPVWKGSGVSVREALADFGVGQHAFGNSRLERALAGVGGMTRPLLLAIRNSFRRRARLVLTLLTLAAGGLFFMAALNVRASLIYSLDRLFDTRKYDLAVNLGTMQPFEKVARAARKTSGVKLAEGWIMTQASIAAETNSAPSGDGGGHSGGGGMHGAGAPPTNSFTVVGLPQNAALLKLDILEGRALQPDETDTIVLNSTLANRNPQSKVGSTINLQMGPAQKLWRVVGVAQESFSPPTAYVPLKYFEVAGGHVGMVNSLRLSLENSDAEAINSVKASLDKNLEQEGVRAQSSSSKADGRFGFDQHMVMIYIFLIVMSCILAGVGGLGLMTTMSLNVLERRREMGVLRAIGASPKLIWLIVVSEGAVIGLLSWALAAIAAWPVSKAIGNLLVKMAFKSGLDFLFEFRGVLIWLAVSIVLCVVASFLPAWNASRCSVREAIGYE